MQLLALLFSHFTEHRRQRLTPDDCGGDKALYDFIRDPHEGSQESHYMCQTCRRTTTRCPHCTLGRTIAMKMLRKFTDMSIDEAKNAVRDYANKADRVGKGWKNPNKLMQKITIRKEMGRQAYWSGNNV